MKPFFKKILKKLEKKHYIPAIEHKNCGGMVCAIPVVVNCVEKTNKAKCMKCNKIINKNEIEIK